MTAPIPSKLDNRQMLQGAYDEATGSFRTTAEATIVNADIDVSLDSTEDNVAIRSSTGIELSINAAGAANIVSTDLGVRADTVATTDTGTFSIIAFIKRGLQNWTTLLSRIPVLGQTVMASSTPVTIASNQTDININPVGNVISIVNTTVTPLIANGTFTGIGEDITQYATITNAIAVDRSGTFQIQFGANGVDFPHIQSYPINVSSPGTVETFFFSIMCQSKWYRIVFINGATAQGTLRIQSILRKTAMTSEIQQVSTAIIDSTDAIATKGVIYGKTTGGGGGYVAVKVSPSGAMVADVSGSSGLTGTVTANAGTNLNTSALNLEATQLLIKAKTDNIDTPLSNISKGKLLRNVDFDNIAATYNTTQDIYVYKLLTVTQATVTITYTDTSKSLILTVVRT